MTVTTVTPRTSGLLESGRAPRSPYPLPDLARAWDLGYWTEVHWRPAGRASGARIRTDRTAFLLRRCARVTAAQAQWQLDLMATLREQGMPSPAPIPARHGGHVVEAGNRLYVAAAPVTGAPFDANEPFQLYSMGRVLATYHRLVARVGTVAPGPPAPCLRAVIGDRLARFDPAVVPELHHRARVNAARLDALWPRLPQTLVHGGFRRGAMLFDGVRVTAVPELDRLHAGPRCLDLATTLIDVATVHTTPDSTDHAIALDLDKIAVLLAGYRQVETITAAEAEAVPVLIEAKRIKRALGRAEHLHAGEPVSDQDRVRIRTEFARLTWLSDHGAALRAACAEF